MATVRPRVMPHAGAPAGPHRPHHRAPPRTGEADIVTKILEFIPDERQTRHSLPTPTSSSPADGDCSARRISSWYGISPGCWVPKWAAHARWCRRAGSTADRQIGQTGKTIRPKLYIAAGISGAIQHRVGVEGADLIIAINADPNAPIFDFAHYGIVGDAIQFLPALDRGLPQSPVAACRPARRLSEEHRHDRGKIRRHRRRRRPPGNAAAYTMARPA